MVCVGPPLLARPAGSSSGFVLQNEVPVVLAQLAPVKPQVVPSSMLCPPSVKIAVIPAGTPQFPPEVLLASMLFVTVRVPSLLMAPPRVALLPEKVLLVTVREPGLGMAPPRKLVLLPEKVLVVTVAVPAVETPAAAPPALVAMAVPT